MASILIVEDDTVLREVLLEFLSAEHTCFAVSTGEEALSRLVEAPVDVLLTDISMPGMSGLELLAHVKQRWAETSVVILSGISDKQYAEGLFKMGAFDYLIKPFSLEDMRFSVALAIEEHKKLCAAKATTADVPKVAEVAPTANVASTNTAIFSSVQLGEICSLHELLEIVQRGRMSGYIELQWNNVTIEHARRHGKFNDANGQLDQAVLNGNGWIYLRDGLIIDATIDEQDGSAHWREPEEALKLLVKLSTYIGKGVLAWGISTKQMDRAAMMEVGDNSAKVFNIITRDEQEDSHPGVMDDDSALEESEQEFGTVRPESEAKLARPTL